MSPLEQQIIAEARKYVGVHEVGHNSGPQVDVWLERVRRRPGDAWCVAFAWCMLDDACRALGLDNHMPPVAGGYLLMRTAKDFRAWTDRPRPGLLFGIDHGKNAAGNHLSHVGIVADVRDGVLHTIEGNTNVDGSREGNCVAARTRRPEVITLGYLDPDALLDNSPRRRRAS